MPRRQRAESEDGSENMQGNREARRSMRMDRGSGCRILCPASEPAEPHALAAVPRVKRPHIGHRVENPSHCLAPLLRLKNNCINIMTLKNYVRAIEELVVFALNSCDLSEIVEFDQLVALYLIFLAESSSGTQAGNDIIAAVLHFLPSLRGSLHESGRCLAGFRAERPVVSHRPLSRGMLGMLILLFLRLGSPVGDVCAAIVWAQYRACARLSEITELQVGDVVFDQSDDCSVSFSIGPSSRGASSKSGQNEGSLVKCRGLRSLLFRILGRHRKTRSKNLFFTISKAHFERLFKKAQVGLWRTVFTSHSIRHGRASESAREGVAAADLMTEGRWKSLRTMSRYRRPHLLTESEACVLNVQDLEVGKLFWNSPHQYLLSVSAEVLRNSL